MTPGHGVSFGEACRAWVHIAIHSFGGPAAQISVMHRVVVDEKRWLGEERFLHALNYCMLLPGPEAQQLATYLGWLLHGVPGGLAAGGLFVLPGFLSILGLSLVYVHFHEVVWVAGLLFGVKAAVLAVVLEAVLRIGGRVLQNRAMIAVAVAAFVAMSVLGVPFPLVVLGAGVAGLVGSQLWPAVFSVLKPRSAEPGAARAALDDWLDAKPTRPSAASTLLAAGVALLLWLAPVAACSVLLGPDHVSTRIGAFFGTAAIVTFGGAYSVLAFVAQQAVEVYGWLTAPEMLDGLGLAEATPGPLIQVVQFVGFLAAFRQPGALDPTLAGVLGAVLTTWVTFVPSFGFIFVGAPYVEWLRGNASLTAALSSITAAVVGVVANLGVWLAARVLFTRQVVLSTPLGGLTVPDLVSLDVAALAIAVAAGILILRFHRGMLGVLAGSAVAGLFWRVLG